MSDIILGAGFTGMAAGIKTGATIYESTDNVGGICRTYEKEGFEFDVGGPHWLFGQNKSIEWIKELIPIKTYERNAGVYFNKILPYPIQTHLTNQQPAQEGYFKDWTNKKFSPELCNLFFHPFNEKYMAGLYDEVLQFDTYKTPPPGSNGHVAEFHNPVGGLNALTEIMAKKCHIVRNKTAVSILPEEKKVVFRDGEIVSYDRLISTIPLNSCLYISGVRNFDLHYTSVFVLNIGAEPGDRLPKQHWLYVPFCKSLFHRVGFYTNVEPSKAPEGKVGLSVELAFCGWDYEDLDVPFIIRNIVEELQSWGWIKDVIVTDPTWVKVAYTYSRAWDEVETHLEWLKRRDIISIGRYGKWKFCGLAESIQDGLSV